MKRIITILALGLMLTGCYVLHDCEVLVELRDDNTVTIGGPKDYKPNIDMPMVPVP